MELEEHYHTRLLAYVLDMFGLPFRVTPPAFVMRQFVKLAVFIPENRSFAFVGASEMAGCAMFDLLGQAGAALFADEPDVADRIQLLYGEILTGRNWPRRVLRRSMFGCWPKHHAPAL